MPSFTPIEQAIGLAIVCFGLVAFLYCMDRACTTMSNRRR